MGFIQHMLAIILRRPVSEIHFVPFLRLNYLYTSIKFQISLNSNQTYTYCTIEFYMCVFFTI